MTPAGERLGWLMAAYGDSCRSAADLCGVDHTTIVRVRQGETENPDTLAKIAEGYGVTAEWLRGAKDLQIDFRLHVLTRPPEERLQLLWDAGQRLKFTFRFLQGHGGEEFAVEPLATRVGVQPALLEALTTGGAVPATPSGMEDGLGELLDRLATATGLPRLWLLAGILDVGDAEAVHAKAVHNALQALASRVGARMSAEEIARIAAYVS